MGFAVNYQIVIILTLQLKTKKGRYLFSDTSLDAVGA